MLFFKRYPFIVMIHYGEDVFDFAFVERLVARDKGVVSDDLGGRAGVGLQTKEAALRIAESIRAKKPSWVCTIPALAVTTPESQSRLCSDFIGQFDSFSELDEPPADWAGVMEAIIAGAIDYDDALPVLAEAAARADLVVKERKAHRSRLQGRPYFLG